jgi:hypothetical protein
MERGHRQSFACCRHSESLSGAVKVWEMWWRPQMQARRALQIMYYGTVSTRLKKEGGTRDCFTQMSMVEVDIRFWDGIGCGHTCEILTRVCCGERYWKTLSCIESNLGSVLCFRSIYQRDHKLVRSLTKDCATAKPLSRCRKLFDSVALSSWARFWAD